MLYWHVLGLAVGTNPVAAARTRRDVHKDRFRPRLPQRHHAKLDSSYCHDRFALEPKPAVARSAPGH